MAKGYITQLSDASMPRFIIDGNDSFLQRNWIDNILEFYKLSPADVTKFDAAASSIKEIESAVSQPVFYSSSACYVINNFNALPESACGIVKRILEIDGVFILVSPRGFRDKLPSAYSKLSKICHFLDALPKPDFMVMGWIRKRTSALGLRPGQDSLIMEHAGTNLYDIDHAIEKIEIASKEDRLSNADIIRLSESRADFSASEAVFDLLYGKFYAFDRIFERIRSSQSPIYFLTVFCDIVYKCIHAKLIKASGQDMSAFLQEFGGDRKFSRLWEVPLPLTTLVDFFNNASLPLSEKLCTWRDVEYHVRNCRFIAG